MRLPSAASLAAVRHVVGAAIIRGGQVLAARRTNNAEGAGRWEFPGGKVEAGETWADALIREVAEELSCTIEVVDWFPESVEVGEGQTLHIAQATLPEGEPVPAKDHDRVLWLAPELLDEVDWLDADRVFLPSLHGLLTTPAAGLVRGIVFDEDDAQQVAAEITLAGYRADIIRERLAGEDDDADQPWAVVTDAPTILVELALDRVDGWLELPEPPRPPLPPLDLPTGPRRPKHEN